MKISPWVLEEIVGHATAAVIVRLLHNSGIVSRTLNYVPGVNAVAGMHDVFQVRLDEWGSERARNLLNVPGMVPAAAITYGALMNNIAPLSNALTVQRAR